MKAAPKSTGLTSNPSDYGMIGVTKAEFFATVGQLDVHPHIVNARHDEKFGYRENWKMRDGRIVGVTVGGTHLRPTTFIVTPEFHSANSERFSASEATGSTA